MQLRNFLYLSTQIQHLPILEQDHIKNVRKEILAEGWSTLYNVSYDYKTDEGLWEAQSRDVYDRGNGAAILLYNPEKQTVILTRQFRMPTFENGNPDGMLIEVCAGLLDTDHPADCIRKEVEEETGYTIDKVHLVMETYMSPGSVSEILYLFTGVYTQKMKTGEGGGAREETEHIEVLEYPFKKALQMIETGEIRDAKTIILLQYAALHRLLG